MGGEKLQERDASPPTSMSDPKVLPSIDRNPYFTTSTRKARKLPGWLDHFNSRDLKVLFKCSMAAWIYTLFLFINPTLKFIGQATFFGILVMFMVPPSGVVFISMMAGLTIVLGACLGWAWGTIAMKAALAARPAADLRAQYGRLQQANQRNTTNAQAASGQATYTQIAIYNGGMLDARVSVTYFCLIGLFVYLVARIRVAAPKLTLLQIFAMIISDIYLTVAPLIPTFQGTIPRTLILPAAISMGVSFVCNILFFPRSTSHLVLDGMQEVLKPMNTFLEACHLNLQNPDNHLDIAHLRATRAKVIQTFKTMEGDFGFLALDASVGRWSADDVKSLHEPLRRVLLRFISLVQTQINRREFKLRDEKLDQVVEFLDPEKQSKAKAGTHQMAKIYDYRHRSKHPDSETLLHGSLRAMAHAGGDILQSAQQAVDAVNQSLRLSNSHRWFGRLSAQQCEQTCQSHLAVLNSLRQHKEAFTGRAAADLWEGHKHLFDAEGHVISQEHEDQHPPMGGIILSLVLEEKMYNYVEALEELLACLIELERTRVNVRLWLPGNLQNLLPWALRKDETTNYIAGTRPTMTSSASDAEILNAKESEARSKAKAKKPKKKSKKDKTHDKDLEDTNDSAAAQLQQMGVRGVHRRSAWGKLLVGVAHWFSSTEGMYALRILIVTIALGAPAAIPSSAGFYYREKGLWALIMAQTAMLPYTADFIASFFLRLLGTVMGAVLGMMMWYIGAGNGPGNPYGMAAIAVPLIVVFMWLRLFTNPALMQGVILTVVTMYLVMAYSWVDTHVPSYGNPGVGYEVFWRRMLLVMIGFGAAAVVTFFPRPPSASKHHRRILSESLQQVKNQYALFVLNCHRPTPDLAEVTEKLAFDAGDILLATEPQLALLRFEVSTSNFTAGSLGQICRLSMTLNQTATQLLIYATNLAPEPRARFLQITGADQEDFAADIMAVLSLVQQTLKTGDPLPAILPVPLVVRSMDAARLRVRGAKPEHFFPLSQEVLGLRETRRFCTAMSSFVQFLGTIDELVMVTKTAVGETTWVDLEA